MHRIAPILLISLLFIAGTMPGLAQTESKSVSLADYQGLLRDVQEQLTALSHEAGSSNTVTSASTPALRKVQQRLAAIDQVELANGHTLSLTPLLGVPGQDEITLGHAQAQVDLLLTQLQAASGDDTAVRLALLAAIFQRPEFAGKESLWDRFWRWVRSLLPDAIGNNNSAMWGLPLVRLIGWGLVIIGVILVVWLLSYWLQNLFGSFVGSAQERRDGAGDAFPQSAAEAKERAQQLADVGSYREAVRQLYLSALLGLHERHVLTYRRSDTNREVLAAVQSKDDLHQQLRPVVETFDDVWYGVHEPDQNTYDRYVEAIGELEEMA
ncbi:MAG: DUF4129 domain-containing protein [Caldilineaceae bacterium]